MSYQYENKGSNAALRQELEKMKKELDELIKKINEAAAKSIDPESNCRRF